MRSSISEEENLHEEAGTGSLCFYAAIITLLWAAGAVCVMWFIKDTVWLVVGISLIGPSTLFVLNITVFYFFSLAIRTLVHSLAMIGMTGFFCYSLVYTPITSMVTLAEVVSMEVSSKLPYGLQMEDSSKKRIKMFHTWNWELRTINCAPKMFLISIWKLFFGFINYIAQIKFATLGNRYIFVPRHLVLRKVGSSEPPGFRIRWDQLVGDCTVI